MIDRLAHGVVHLVLTLGIDLPVLTIDQQTLENHPSLMKNLLALGINLVIYGIDLSDHIKNHLATDLQELLLIMLHWDQTTATYHQDQLTRVLSLR